MAQGFATVNGARLWYEEQGSGPALTFVHAGICDHRQWDKQIDAFAAKYRVIRFDMRGFGQSELPPGPFSLSDDIGGLLDALGVERSALVGCSMGGSACIDFTLKQPQRVAALITVCAGMSGGPHEISGHEQAVIEEIEAAEKAGDIDRVNAAEMRLWVDGPHRASEQVAPGVRELMAEMNLAALKREPEWEQAQPLALDSPAAGRLDEIHAPTLVVVGGDDTLAVRMTADQLAEGIVDARKVVMEGLTHVPNMERPGEFNQVLLDFLAQVW
jgi:pimeloyl-ACP methyl ester carboxylesterase